MAVIAVPPRLPHEDLSAGSDAVSCSYPGRLEGGDILLLHDTPLLWNEHERACLLRQDRLPGSCKNIAYDPTRDRVTGTGRRAAGDGEALRLIMRKYSQRITAHLAGLLPQYAQSWHVDLASFRPLEEEGRRLPRLQRNDLLHTDAFPSRPTNGARILRVFTNINPSRTRRWVTSEGFESVLSRYARLPGFPVPRARAARWQWPLRRAARTLGIVPFARPPYDAFMLELHDFLKTSDQFQSSCAKLVHEFPPGASWVLFTDSIPHAALSGRFALEQTYIVPRSALVSPDTAPVTILERWYGGPLTHAEQR
jgi:3-deoxy-D-manno-octulosonic acid hydroxylase-like protein